MKLQRLSDTKQKTNGVLKTLGRWVKNVLQPPLVVAGTEAQIICSEQELIVDFGSCHSPKHIQ